MPSRRMSLPCLTLAAAGALLLAAVLTALAPPVRADGDVFTVRGVAVDVTAATAAAARDQAIARAQRDAFDRLIQRLTGGGAAPALEAGALERLVAGFQVEEERSSAVRYVGRFAVGFSPAGIRALLQARGIPYAETRSKPVVVLPVDRSGGDAVLWQRETAWREAWGRVGGDVGLVPIVVPPGDLQDVADIGAAEALAGDRVALKRIADRYGAETVVVAELGADGRGITTHLYRGEAPPDRQSATAESGQDGLSRSAAALVARLEAEWARANLLQPGVQNEIRVTVPFTALEEWAETRRRLASVPNVTRARILSLSRSEAEIDLAFLGDAERLKTALAQRDLRLDEAGGVGGASWRLSRTGPAAPPLGGGTR